MINEHKEKLEAKVAEIESRPNNTPVMRGGTVRMPGIMGIGNPDTDGLPMIGQALSAMSPEGRRAAIKWIDAMYGGDSV